MENDNAALVRDSTPLGGMMRNDEAGNTHTFVASEMDRFLFFSISSEFSEAVTRKKGSGTSMLRNLEHE